MNLAAIITAPANVEMRRNDAAAAASLVAANVEMRRNEAAAVAAAAPVVAANVVSDVNELCPICKLVPQEPNPNSHINLHHYRQINQTHTFVCEACDRRFPEKRLAKEHAYVAHGELTRVKQVYSCPVCALPYSQPIKVYVLSKKDGNAQPSSS